MVDSRPAAARGATFNPGAALLALDLGTTTGWALRLPEGTVISGTVAFSPGRHEGGGMRFLRFRAWLDEIAGLAQPAIGTIVFEEVRRHLGTDAAQIYGGFLAHLSAWAEGRQIPYRGVPVQAIKKFATGAGNAKKEVVIAAMEARGFRPQDDNEADALAMLLGTIKAAW